MAAKKSTGVVAGLKIRVNYIEFGKTNAFRKLKGIRLPIAERITLICGHNGIGKSTILGMLASASGLTKETALSYFGRTYEASVNDILFIDHAAEVAARKKSGTLSEPIIQYEVNGLNLMTVCSLRQRGSAPRARVVSQRNPIVWFEKDGFVLGPEAKVPLPTLYLGLTRMLPVGETPDVKLQVTPPVPWHADDEAFLHSFVKRVIPHSNFSSTSGVGVNMVKGTKKVAAHPVYTHGTKSVSVGQDSLGAIAAALASFHRIRRLLGSAYPGGILIIDELDACFHPHAIGALVREIRKEADKLQLQIVATTHSPRLIEAVHPEGTSDGFKKKDSVIYLRDTKAPVFDESMTLIDILRDMDLTPPAAASPPTELKVYFEDDEACEVFSIVTRKEFIAQLELKYDVKIAPMPLGIGCSSLASLPSKDPYFNSVVLVADADGSRPKKIPSNLVDLPGGTDAAGKGLSPERTLIGYIASLVGDSREAHPVAWNDPRLKKFSSDSLHANLLHDLPGDVDRHVAKKWWRGKYQYIKQWGLYSYWAAENTAKVLAYENAFETAVKSAAKAKRSQLWAGKTQKTS